MACSSQPLAAVVGRDILKAGGNAADAAVAMAAMVNVTEPMMNGLGGDCMVLVHWDGAVFGLNGAGRVGSRLTIDNLRAAGFSSMPQAGAATVTVPGALDGYLALHERFGSIDLAALVEPAAAYAEEGSRRRRQDRPGRGNGAPRSSSATRRMRALTCRAASRQSRGHLPAGGSRENLACNWQAAVAPRFMAETSATACSSACIKAAAISTVEDFDQTPGRMGRADPRHLSWPYDPRAAAQRARASSRSWCSACSRASIMRGLFARERGREPSISSWRR